MTGEPTGDTGYFLANRDERERLEALEAWLDPGTIEHLEKIGIAPGWRCLEVGAGGGSIVRWLCERVGPTGHVVATDIDTRPIGGFEAPNLEVRTHNIVTDELEENAFDLVHERAVLQHLPGRDQALARMARAVKPGGWLFLEDGDYISWAPVAWADDVDAEVFAAFGKALFSAPPRPDAAIQTDFLWARRLGPLVRQLEFLDVHSDGRVAVFEGGSPIARLFWGRTWEMARPAFLASGFSEQEVDRVTALYRDPTFEWMGPVIVSAWGRKPGGQG